MKQTFSLMAFAAGLLLTACQRDSLPSVHEVRKEIKITASIAQTKATATAFETGDQIGLSIGAPVNLSRVALNCTQNGIEPGTPLLWPVDCETTTHASFSAWYPYAFTDNFNPMADVAVTLPADQYSPGMYAAWDLLGANASATPADESVNLVFSHLFSRLKLTVVDQLTTDRFKDVQTDAFLSVEVNGIMQNAVVNVSASSVSVSGEESRGLPCRAGEKTYWLLVAPQKASPEIVLRLHSGKTVSYRSSAPIVFRSGKQVSAILVLKDEEILFNCEIMDWSDDDSSWPLERQQPNNEVWYTTTDGEKLAWPWSGQMAVADEDLAPWFDAGIVSHTYEDGMGVIQFNADVTEVGMDPYQSVAFQSLYNLKTIAFPQSVKAIGSGSFINCENLETVYFPSHLEKLGDGLFANCNAMKELCVPEFDKIDNLDLPGQRMLFYCSNLEKFTGPYASGDGRCLIKGGTLLAFASSGLSSYTLPSGITEIRAETFYNSSLKNILLPNTLRDLGCKAFEQASLSSVILPESLAYIGDEAFAFTNLVSIHIPQQAELGTNVFKSCLSLERFSGRYASADGRFLARDHVIIAFAPDGLLSYQIPEGIVGIACKLGTRKIGVLTLPSTLESIGDGSGHVFSFITRYDDLHTLVCLADVPPEWPVSFYADTGELETFKTIYVPAASVEAYKAAEGWKIYADFIKPLPVASTAVDLGLPSGTKWASCNLGATVPEEDGMYFCWGDVSPQQGFYAYGSYRYQDFEGNLTKYYADGGLTELAMEDDAACYWLGEGWQIPSWDDYLELSDYCDFSLDTIADVNGYRVTSNENGNSVFFPIHQVSNYGLYWSRLFNSTNRAKSLYITSSGVYNFDAVINATMCIRPVYKEQ